MAQTDRDALAALYDATDGPNWRNKTNWGTDAALSDWYGVTANDEGRVLELSLDNNDLRGPIPAELGKLTALERLNLGSNNLSGNIPPELGKLTALTSLSLWSNQLTGPIPAELGNLAALESLELWGNQLSGSIPPELGNLRALKVLYLRNNELSGNIPPQLGQLGALEFLNLANNKLDGTIPSELGKLTALSWLDLGHNQLSGTIPEELGKLTALGELFLDGNNLSGAIPAQLGALTNLTWLSLSNNQLHGLWDCGAHTEGTDAHVEHRSGGGIPRELDEFLNFLGGVRFSCGSNPWVEPPAAVLGEAGNIPAVRSYFVDLYQDTRVVSRSLKVVLVGREDTGKTSLRQSIAAGRAAPTQWPAESTVHMTIQDTTLGGVSVRILDCAGQVAYYGLLQLFLTRRAVYLLVWNASQEGCNQSGACTTDDLEALGILPWLKALSFRLPGGDVILVGNKCDLRSGAQDAAAHAASVESACRDWLARVCSSGGRAVEIEKGASLTSCALPGWWTYLTSGALRGLAWISGLKMGWPCDWKTGVMSWSRPPSLLDRIVRARNDGPLRAEEMVLPQSWGLALSFLRDLSDNERNDAKAAAVAGDRTVLQQGARTVYHGIARDELFLLWESTVRERELPVPNPTSALEGALTIREYEGTVLSVGTYVFLDVDWLAKVLEPLLNHKGIEDKGAARVFGDVEVTEQWQMYSLRKLEDEGILEQRLAGFLWPGYKEHVLATLELIGLTFPCPGDDGGGLVVPLRLPETRPLYVGQHLANFRDDHRQKSLTMHWNMPHGVPPGGVERVVSRCSNVGVASLFWRFGVLVRVGAEQAKGEDGDDDVGRSCFMLEYNSYRQELVIEVWGDLAKADAWATLSYVYAVVGEMTQQYPGLRWEAYLGCPDHPSEDMCISETQSRGDRLVAKEHICRQCRFTGNGAAFLASELLIKVDDIKGSTPRSPLNANTTQGNSHLSAGVIFQQTVDRVSEIQTARVSTGGTPTASSPKAQGRSIEYQAGRQLELSRGILPAVGCPLPAKDLEMLTANMRNLRLHCTREDVQQIVEGSNQKVLEELLQAITTLGTHQTDGQRRLAREVAGLTIRIPSHAVLLPPRAEESLELTDAERAASSWIQRLKDWRADGKRRGKGVVSKEYRLFFLCGHDHSLAECGFEGKGYRIKCSREWVRKGGLPFMKALLIVVGIALKTFAGLSFPADIASAGGKAWEEILLSTVEGVAEASTDAVCSAAGERLDNGREIADSVDQTAPAHNTPDVGRGLGGHSNASSQLPTPREATEMLEKLVRDLSIEGLKKSSGAGHSSFLCFDTTMQLVDKAGKGEEWSWVRLKNVQAFTAQARAGDVRLP